MHRGTTGIEVDSRLGCGGSRGLKNREIRTVRRENNVVRREERDPAFGGSGDLTRIDRQHMGRHVGREVVDDHRWLLGEQLDTVSALTPDRT